MAARAAPFRRRGLASRGRRELADEELYACDAQWSGLYDRMMSHTPEETERRRELAALYETVEVVEV